MFPKAHKKNNTSTKSAAKAKSTARKRRPLVSMSIDEIKTLLRSVPDQRNRLMLLVGFWHGLRVSESNELTAGDIQFGQIDVQRLKGSLRTVQPIIWQNDPELDESEGLLELSKLPKDERLFPMTRDGVRKVMQRHGIPAGIPAYKLTPHALKHSIAKHMIKEAGIENTRQWLGHKNMSSTGAYLGVSDQEAAEALVKAMGGGLVSSTA